MGRTAVRIGLVGGILLALTAAAALAGVVRTDGIILKAEGSFTPSVLPPRAYRPITLRGHVNISTDDHRVPPAVTRFDIDFSHDGRLQTRGLPVCSPEEIGGTTPDQARKLCGDAIVATGNVEALIHLPEQPQVPVRTPLTVFNGPPQGGNPTVVFHSYSWFPESETYVVSAAIIRPTGRHPSFHVDVEVPPIADGYGSITHADIKIGKSYRYRGRELSYTSAHCPDGVLEAHGRMTFANGTVIAGSVYRPCGADRQAPTPR
jgi:hypothetical protein